MFSDAGPDVRWCGNENGTAGDPNWSMVNPDVVTFPGADGPGVTDALQHGDRAGTLWRSAEVDVSIRPGWFYHPAEDDRVRTVENLESLYFSSVGRNGKLLLNVPPTRDGLLHSVDVAQLTQFRARITSLFERDLAGGARRTTLMPALGGVQVELDLGRPLTIGVARLVAGTHAGKPVGFLAVLLFLAEQPGLTDTIELRLLAPGDAVRLVHGCISGEVPDVSEITVDLLSLYESSRLGPSTGDIVEGPAMK